MVQASNAFLFATIALSAASSAYAAPLSSDVQVKRNDVSEVQLLERDIDEINARALFALPFIAKGVASAVSAIKGKRTEDAISEREIEERAIFGLLAKGVAKAVGAISGSSSSKNKREVEELAERAIFGLLAKGVAKAVGAISGSSSSKNKREIDEISERGIFGLLAKGVVKAVGAVTGSSSSKNKRDGGFYVYERDVLDELEFYGRHFGETFEVRSYGEFDELD